ncbi:MAG: hypothetical protein ABSC51_00205 [Gaiellaceae bacterium]
MNIEEMRELVLSFVSENLELEVVGEKVACVLPVDYPDGDAVVVYLSERQEGIELSDYGLGWEKATFRTGMKNWRARDAAESICRNAGISFWKGRVTTLAKPSALADVIWRVGLASMSIAEAPTFTLADVKKETTFVDEVETVLQTRRVEVLRESPLVGDSGHSYRPTFFLPSRHAVVEPLSPESGWQRASAIYVEFGDISRTNGYDLMAVLDDRATTPNDQVLSLLLQVGSVVQWSQRDPWLANMAGLD